MNNRSIPYSLRYPSYVFLYLLFLLAISLLFCVQSVYGQTCQFGTHIDPSKSTPTLFNCVGPDEMAEAGILSFRHQHDFKQSGQNIKPLKLSEAKYYLNRYHENYNYYNNQAWFQYSKKTFPLAASWYLHGFLQTANLLSLNMLQMFSVSLTISSVFNLGQDTSVEFSRAYDHLTGTSPDPDNWPSVPGRVSGGLTMLLLDLTLEDYFNANLPKIKALTYPETVSKFIKSVAITGPLTKAMIGLTREKLINAGFAEDSSTALAQGGSAATLGALLSLGTLTGLTSMGISTEIEKTAQLKQVTDAVADEFVKMTTSQKVTRNVHEQFPRAATVTAAYVTVDALINTCKVGLNRLELEQTISKDRQDELCMLMVSATSLAGSWLGLNSDKWVKDGFLGVFVENIAEAGGMHTTGAIMKAAGSLSDEPITRDLLKLTGGTLSFTAFYSKNLAYPDKAFELNSRNGAHLNLVIEGVQIVMSHVIPFTIVSSELVADLAAERISGSLYNLSHQVDLLRGKDNEQENSRFNLENSRYQIPVHGGCFMTPAVGTTTETYQMNNNCY